MKKVSSIFLEGGELRSSPPSAPGPLGRALSGNECFGPKVVDLRTRSLESVSKTIQIHIVNVTLFFKSVGKILILLQIRYKLISRLFRSHRTRKFGLKIFPTNLTPSNHEIKILKTPNFACFFSKTILKITFWPNIFCELVLRSR